MTTKYKKCSKCGEVKEVREFNKRSAKLDGLNAWCKSCHKAWSKKKRETEAEHMRAKSNAWKKANRRRINNYQRDYYLNNIEKYKTYKSEWRRKNKDKILEKKAEWRRKNKDKVREESRNYKKRNPHKVNARNKERHCKKLNLTPPLTTYDKERIEALYKEAKQLEKKTGAPYHVDHVWPISKGGVHHWCNLEVIPAARNLSKSDRHDGVSGVSYNDYMLAQQAI